MADLEPTDDGDGGGRTWPALRAHTPARIGLPRSGGSIGTTDALALQLAHAAAHDAIARELELPALLATFAAAGWKTITVCSGAPDRETFVRRPDLGRLLDARSGEELRSMAVPVGYDIAFIVADGLSALAVERHAASLLRALRPQLEADGWTLAPLIVASRGRVAIADHIASALRARMSVVLIGERPGLSVVDSLGLYVTWDPRPGRSDAERNCISNVHGSGLTYDAAAARLYELLTAARAARRTGTELVSWGGSGAGLLDPG